MIRPLKHNQYLTAFETGRGLFETLLVHRDKPRDLGAHLNRLLDSARHFGVRGDLTENDIISRLDSKLVDLMFSTLKIVLYIEGQDAYYHINHSPYRYDENALSTCVTTALADYPTNRAQPLLYHKSLNYFSSEIKLKAAQQMGCFDLVQYNELRNITEGYKSNLFIKRAGQWCTPPQSDGLLAGIARDYFIKKLRAIEETIRIDSIAIEQFKTADIVVFTNSLIGCISGAGYRSEIDKQIVDQIRHNYLWRK